MSPDEPNLPFDGPESERRPRRVHLDGEVSLKFKEHPGFFEERSANLSPGGMFVRSTEPQPPGTVFDFELTLEGEPRLIHGIGEVAWVREGDEGFDRPPGMGVRFLSLEPESREVIDRLVAERLEEDELPAPPAWLGTPAAAPELEEGPGRGSEMGTDPHGEPDPDDEPPAVPRMPGPSPYAYARSYRGAGVSRDTRRRGPLLAVLLALALLVVLAAAFLLLFPETAMRLLLGEGGGGEDPGELVEVVAGDDQVPEPVEPVEPAADAEAGAADAPEEAEDEIGFFEPPARAPAPAPEPAP
ncbi:MAG TPA: TIGR02266 family protein, partial [Thermoanaerobaculia bacterium]|nr:TIGR02266 family protein [Thermoanaerobaculia bacterium]